MNFQCKLCCFELNTTDRIPKILICGHTLCDQCSIKINECPFDRTIICLEDIKVNHSMVDLIMNMNQKHQCSMQTYCQEHNQFLCFECSEQQHQQCSLLSYTSNYYDIVCILLQKINQIPQQELDIPAIQKKKEQIEGQINEKCEKVKIECQQEYKKLRRGLEDWIQKSYRKTRIKVEELNNQLQVEFEITLLNKNQLKEIQQLIEI